MNVYPRPLVLTAVIHESLEKRPNKVYKAVDPLVLKLLKNVSIASANLAEAALQVLRTSTDDRDKSNRLIENEICEQRSQIWIEAD